MRARALGVCLLLLLFAAPRAGAQCNNDFILISTVDLFGGVYSTSVLNGNKTATNNVEPLLGSGTLRTFYGRVFVLTDTNKLELLDPCSNFDHSLASVTPSGSTSLPHDIVMVSPTIGYATLYERTQLQKINLSTGFLSYQIPILPWADADNIPETDQMFMSDGRLYICAQRVIHSTGAPTGTSMLGVFDIATETLVDMDPGTVGTQGIPLIFQRPYSEINYRAHAGAPRAYFSCIGVIGVNDGGVIECKMSNPAEQSVILTEANAGGDIVDVEIISDTKGFAIVSEPSSVMDLIAFNPATGLKIGSTMFTVGGNEVQRYIFDCEPSSLGLLVTDFSVYNISPGIRCFDMTTNTEIGGLISVGTSPWDILVRNGASVTDAGAMPVAPTLGLK
jgi:hypothetical protein